MPNIAENVNRIYPSPTASEAAAYYGKIEEWRDIYAGLPPWKTVSFTTLTGKKTRRMDMLNTAKLLCDSLSAFTFAEQCDIAVSDSEYDKFLTGTLNSVHFWELLPEWLSCAYALGGGALKVFSDGGKICIDFVDAGSFFPVKWTGHVITAGAFQTTVKLADSYYTLLELQEPGKITHKLFKSGVSDVLGNECPLSEAFEGLNDTVTLKGADAPLFAYFRPAVSNNMLDRNVPLGISVFANAVDTLHLLDITFDSLGREFVLGKKRIIVPAEAVQEYTDSSGESRLYFDTNDEAFVALNVEDVENLKIIDNSAELRIEPHISSVEMLLNTLCAQTGLSNGSLAFDGAQGVKTATEVISQESKTARTVKNNKNVLNETLEQTFRAVFTLAQCLGILPPRKYDITIGWKDNIIIDDSTLIDDNIKLVSAGLKSKLSAVMAVLKCDEETAKKEMQKIAEETPSGENAGDLFGDDEQ